MQKKLESFKIFIKLADVLNANDPIIAHCCRLFYVQKILTLKKQANLQTTPEEQAELSAIIKKIEDGKKANPITKEEIKAALEKFCEKRFVYMDKVDHTVPKINKGHAIQFSDTAHYIELLII